METLSDADRKKMQAAQTLIREKRYSEARALLVDVNHPRATDWILRLDPLIADQEQRERQTSGRRTLIIVAVIVILLGAAVYTLHQRDVENQAAAMRYVCSLTNIPESDAWYRCLTEP